jgi:hypothetical protein
MGSPGPKVIRMKDFSVKARVVEFTVDGPEGKVFRGKPHLAAQTMIDFTLKAEGIDEKSASQEEGLNMALEAIGMVLMPDSFKTFRDRMREPEPDAAGSEPYVPIELPQMMDILQWVMGEYGMRPTTPPSESSDGLPGPDSGTNSTASTSVEA